MPRCPYPKTALPLATKQAVGAEHPHLGQEKNAPELPFGRGTYTKGPPTWRIIPFSKWLVTPIYKPFRPFGMGILINHLLTGMILQVVIR